MADLTDKVDTLQLEDQFCCYPALTEGHFRLLTVVKIEDSLKCEIKDFPFKSPPKFFALSYTWGDEDATAHILLNDELFAVRPNLYHALDQLSRKPELEGSWIWIDAICINQQDWDERNIQELPPITVILLWTIFTV